MHPLGTAGWRISPAQLWAISMVKSRICSDWSPVLHHFPQSGALSQVPSSVAVWIEPGCFVCITPAFPAITGHTLASFCWAAEGRLVALAARWTCCSLYAEILLCFFSFLLHLFTTSLFCIWSWKQGKPSLAKPNGSSRKEMLEFCNTSHKKKLQVEVFALSFASFLFRFYCKCKSGAETCGLCIPRPGFGTDKCMLGWLQETNRMTCRHLQSFWVTSTNVYAY